MVIQLISDLHTELWPSPLTLFAETVDESLAYRHPDFLVLAGDIVQFGTQGPDLIDKVFQYFCQRAKHVIYVPGNHEYWSGTLESENMIKALTRRYTNFYWLQNDDVTIDGVHFYGGSMWFPWLEDTKWRFESGEFAWPDFHEIKDFRKTYWPYQLNKDFTAAGKMKIKEGSVVISHYLPNHRSSPVEFQLNVTNRFFVTDQSELIFTKEPRYWLHGHTHTKCDYVLNNTRIVCNPFGYNKRPYPPVYLEI